MGDQLSCGDKGQIRTEYCGRDIARGEQSQTERDRCGFL